MPGLTIKRKHWPVCEEHARQREVLKRLQGILAGVLGFRFADCITTACA